MWKCKYAYYICIQVTKSCICGRNPTNEREERSLHLPRFCFRKKSDYFWWFLSSLSLSLVLLIWMLVLTLSFAASFTTVFPFPPSLCIFSSSSFLVYYSSIHSPFHLTIHTITQLVTFTYLLYTTTTLYNIYLGMSVYLWNTIHIAFCIPEYYLIHKAFCGGGKEYSVNLCSCTHTDKHGKKFILLRCSFHLLTMISTSHSSAPHLSCSL